jgi:selT/selW/selH-like putative selenoprotein
MTCGNVQADGSVDNLFKITRAVACNYYYVPGLKELAELPELEEAIKAKEVGEEDEEAVGKGKEIEGEEGGEKKVKVFFEYCTNCGYKTIFVEKKRVLEALSPRIQVVGNPRMPRLAAFEVTLEDGTVLWSKLSDRDGHNNFPHVFPTNEQLVLAARRHIPDLGGEDNAPAEAAIYRDKKTRVGVW